MSKIEDKFENICQKLNYSSCVTDNSEKSMMYKEYQRRMIQHGKTPSEIEKVLFLGTDVMACRDEDDAINVYDAKNEADTLYWDLTKKGVDIGAVILHLGFEVYIAGEPFKDLKQASQDRVR